MKAQPPSLRYAVVDHNGELAVLIPEHVRIRLDPNNSGLVNGEIVKDRVLRLEPVAD
jgi:hypothetical protein